MLQVKLQKLNDICVQSRLCLFCLPQLLGFYLRVHLGATMMGWTCGWWNPNTCFRAKEGALRGATLTWKSSYQLSVTQSLSSEKELKGKKIKSKQRGYPTLHFN